MYTRVRDFGASSVKGAASAAADTRAPVDAGATLATAGAAGELADATATTTALEPAESAWTAEGATDTVDTPNDGAPTPDVTGFEGVPNPKLNHELPPALLLLLLLPPPNTKPLPLDDDANPNGSVGVTGVGTAAAKTVDESVTSEDGATDGTACAVDVIMTRLGDGVDITATEAGKGALAAMTAETGAATGFAGDAIVVVVVVRCCEGNGFGSVSEAKLGCAAGGASPFNADDFARKAFIPAVSDDTGSDTPARKGVTIK